MHLLAAVGLTAVLASGLAGLGGLLGGRGAADCWVRGWSLAWWIVAAAAQLTSPRVAVAVGIVLVAAGLPRAVAAARTDLGGAAWLAAGLLAGAPLWLLPPYFYDTLVYHLGLPSSWLANASFATVPHNLFSHFPLAGSTVFLLPAALGLPEAAAGLHWASLLVALVTLARLAASLGARRWRWAAPALLLACWHAVWISSVAAVDTLVVVALLAMLQHALPSGENGRTRAIGLGSALGLALSLKYSAAIPAAAVVAVAACSAPAPAVAALALGGLTSSFWWVRNLLTTGNPVYPLLWTVLGGRGWSAGDERRYSALIREGVDGLASVPHGVVYLLRPPEGLGWWAVAALPLVVLALLPAARERRARMWVGAAAALMLVGWLATSQTTRYALPLAALVAVLAAAGLADLGRRAAPVAAAALGVAALHGVLGLGSFAFGVLNVEHAWPDAEAWRHRVTVDDPVPAYRRCAGELPAGARLLVIGDGRPWGCRLPNHVSSPYDSQLVQAVVEEAATARAAADTLRAAGFTHLLINWGEVNRLGGPDFQALAWHTPAAAARWRELLGGFTRAVFTEAGVEVRGLVRDGAGDETATGSPPPRRFTAAP
jgi:hypothetical protein